MNTGVLVDRRRGTVLERGKGKSFLKNQEWLQKMEGVERRLRHILNIIQGLEGPSEKSEAAATIDSERDSIIRTLNEIWETLGLPQLPLPSQENSTYVEE